MGIRFVMAVCLVLLLFFLLDIYYEVNYPKLKFVDIHSAMIPPGKPIKILQLSDYHDSRFPGLEEKVLRYIEEVKPHMVVITGDLIDENRTRSLENVEQFITKIAGLHSNIFFVAGNHEWKNRNKNKLIKRLSDSGIEVLNNTNRTIEISGAKINIIGVDDYYTHHSDFRKALAGLDRSLYSILLSHVPDVAWRESPPVDLIISGHTHGGQIRFPFLGAVIAPCQGLFPKYDKGLFTINDRTVLYIDSGLGTSRIPVRFLCRAQVSVITISSGKK